MKRLSALASSYDRKLTPKLFEITIATVIGLAFLVSLVAGHSIRPYTSDDVSTQIMMQNWNNGQSRDATFSTDSWVLKMPLYEVQDLAASNSRTQLFISSLVFDAILFAGLIYFIHTMILRGLVRTRLTIALAYLPVGWFLGLTVLPITPSYMPPRIMAFLNPNFRNAEIGVALLLITIFSSLLTRSFTKLSFKQLSGYGLLALLVGAFIYNDPYFLYMLIVPMLALLAVQWLRDKTTTLPAIKLGAGMAAAVFVSLVLGRIGHKLGFTTLDNIPRQFIQANDLWNNLVGTISAQSKLFGADFWGHVVEPKNLFVFLNSGLLLFSVVATTSAVLRRRTLSNPKLLLLLIVTANIGLYSLITINSPTNARYLIISSFAEVLLLASYAAESVSVRWRWLLVGLFSLGLLLNTGNNLRVIASQHKAGADKPNAINQKIIEVVEREGFTKGYGAYWDSHITTYLSSLKVHVLPVLCNGQTINKMYWLMNKPEFDTKVDKSFYVYAAKDEEPNVTACTARTLEPVLGAPAKTIPIDSTYTIYTYDYDIGTRLQRDPSL